MKVALDRLRNDYEDALEETESRSKVIDELEKMVENLREKLLKSNKMEEKQRQLADAFKKETIELEKEIQDFKKENTKLSNISKRLNIQLSNTRKKHAVEKDKIVTNFREELKLVKKRIRKGKKGEGSVRKETFGSERPQCKRKTSFFHNCFGPHLLTLSAHTHELAHNCQQPPKAIT